jgi:hypothetical protein
MSCSQPHGLTAMGFSTKLTNNSAYGSSTNDPGFNTAIRLVITVTVQFVAQNQQAGWRRYTKFDLLSLNPGDGDFDRAIGKQLVQGHGGIGTGIGPNQNRLPLFACEQKHILSRSRWFGFLLC